MPLLIPPGVVPSNHPSATPLNSLEKALDVDPVFNLQCQQKSFEAVYSYHQQQHLELMQVLDSIPEQFHKLPFHQWIARNTPVNALTDKAHEMLWHQRLIHMSPQSIQQAYQYVDGVPNLTKFKFDDIDGCSTCIKANLRKKFAGK